MTPAALKGPLPAPMSSPASNRLKSNAMASGGPSLDLFGYAIEEDGPDRAPDRVIKVVSTAIMPEIPVRPFSVVRVSPTVVWIVNE